MYRDRQEQTYSRSRAQIKGKLSGLSKPKTRRFHNVSAQDKKRIKFAMFFLVMTLVIVQQSAYASSVQTLNKIGYSEMDAINKGMDLFQVSAKSRDQNKQFNAAVKAYTQQEFALAFRLFEPLAIHGHSSSQYYLGVLHDMGVEYSRNARVAYQWYRLAALAGDDRAQHNLAVAYAKGDGVDVNMRKAMKWWMTSALQGNADSQYNLGILYAMGQQQVEKNILKAMKWWRKAATSGDAVAQFNLGTIYANGDNGTKNYCEAERWWVQSAESGFSEANYALTILRKRSDYYSCY